MSSLLFLPHGLLTIWLPFNKLHMYSDNAVLYNNAATDNALTVPV